MAARVKTVTAKVRDTAGVDHLLYSAAAYCPTPFPIPGLSRSRYLDMGRHLSRLVSAAMPCHN